jgi:hypothetical protein
MLLPVEDAEHQLQVHANARSPAALQLLGYASAAQRAAGVSRETVAQEGFDALFNRVSRTACQFSG